MRWLCVLALVVCLLAGCSHRTVYQTPAEAVRAELGPDVELLATWDMPFGKLGIISDPQTDLAERELRILDGGWFVGSGGKASPWVLPCLTLHGSFSVDPPLYGFAYGRITDPQVVRVLVTAPEVGTAPARVVGDVWMMLNVGASNIHYTRVTGLDKDGQVVCEDTTIWPNR